MSKLYDIYSSLKSNEPKSDKTLYLFKSGIFFILIDEDAKIASKILNLKITFLTENIVKCGFPISSLEKYSSIIQHTDYKFQIIDSSSNINYSLNQDIKTFLLQIADLDTNNLSIKEAYEILDNFKNTSTNLLKCI
ncbi:MAG: hypothetical protein ACLTKT_07305 [Clostridia bacterium]|nr:hypothetical protein [Clostridium sp.]